jgi:protein-tyrosine phosphatase
VSEPRFTILVVCTANLCRSPIAQFLLASAIRDDAALAGTWRVSSAGTHATPGSPMHPLADAVLTERGVPHAPFRTRVLTAEAVAAADLVLTATREHRRRVVELAPNTVRRAFTLREFGRLARVLPDTAGQGSDRGARLVAQVPMARSLSVPASPDDDEIPDPIGGRLRAFRRCADLIERAVTEVVRG